MVLRALAPAGPVWEPATLVDEFNVDRPAPDPAVWRQVSSAGVNSFTGLGQLLAGNVLANNVRNRSLQIRTDHRVLSGKWLSTYTVGDAVNTGLENTHGITDGADPMSGRGVYLYAVSGTTTLRFRAANGSVSTSANSGGSAPVGTRFELESVGGGQYVVRRNGVKLGATRVDPYGPLDYEQLKEFDARPYHEQVSDRNVFGAQGWGSRVQRWAFSSTALA